MRDGRRAVLAAGIGLGLFVFAYGSSIGTNYPTLASRREAIDATLAVSAIGSMTGPPINAATLGGFLSWRVLNLLPLLLGAWSVVALSGTLAGEIRTGSFEMLAAVPQSRRRIAIAKLAVHVAGLAVAAALIGGLTWLAGLAFGRLPGDAIGLLDALVHAGAMALLGLVGGAVAFAAAPFVGRGASAGIGAAVLVAAYFVDAYRGTVDAFGRVAGLSWFAWTERERPIAGTWETTSLVPVAVLAAGLLAAGVLAFERRDVGATLPTPRLALPGNRLLLRGPARAAFLAGLPAALAWGAGIGVYGWLVGLSAPGFVDQFAGDPSAARVMDAFFPRVDWRTTGGMLQIIFFELCLPFVALGGAMLVGRVASDERERRTDLLLATGISRSRWLAASAAGTYAAIALLAALVGLACAAGAVMGGSDGLRPFVGVFAAGLYAAGLAGVGIGVFGLGRPGLAAGVTAALGVGLTLFGLLGASLKFPAALLDLSPARHLGAPMAGSYDWPGMVLAAGLAAGGLLAGALAFTRRDVRY